MVITRSRNRHLPAVRSIFTRPSTPRRQPHSTSARRTSIWDRRRLHRRDLRRHAAWPSGCEYVIIGHSRTPPVFRRNRRHREPRLASRARIRTAPIVCVGEVSKSARLARPKMYSVASASKAFRGFPPTKPRKSDRCYEPVWAIGTGKPRHPKSPPTRIAHPRRGGKRFRQGIRDKLRILYGGSVKPETHMP